MVKRVGAILYSAPGRSAVTVAEMLPGTETPFFVVDPGAVMVWEIRNISFSGDSKRVVATSFCGAAVSLKIVIVPIAFWATFFWLVAGNAPEVSFVTLK